MMRILFFLFSLALLGISPLAGQVHRYPENGGQGVAGSVPGAYIIGWNHYEGALAYEYVLSDNPLCFIGCAGDTRNSVVFDSLAVEFNLAPQRWYYWITRIYFPDGDTSHWSPISSFFTENQDDLPKLVAPLNNPVSGPEMTFLIDWARNPEAQEISIKLYNQNGFLLRSLTNRRNLAGARFEEIRVPIDGLPIGIYLVEVLAESPQNNRNNFFSLKVQVVR
jgi:hypothetical protein